MVRKFKDLSIYLECASGCTPRVETIKNYIDIMSVLGYTKLYLGVSGAYHIEDEPYFAYKKGKYTTKQLQEIDAYGKEKGIEVIAGIQTLAHLGFMSMHDHFRPLMDTDSTVMVGDERVYELIDKMFYAISKGLSSRNIHIGFDEAFCIGSGNYMKKHGKADGKELILRHLIRVLEIAEKYGYACEIWHDMLTEKGDSSVTAAQVKENLHENTSVVLWDYEEKNEDKLRAMLDDIFTYSDKVAYAGHAWKIAGFTPNNRNSIATILPQMKICAEKGITHYMVTLWADNCSPCSWYAVLPTLFWASEYNLGYTHDKQADKEKFFRLFGVKYDDMMLLDNLDDPFKRNREVKRTTSFCAMYSDILLGNFHLLFPQGVGEAYAKLAKEYAEVDGGRYRYVFDKYHLLAKILSVKSDLPTKLRNAYKANDKKGMKALCGEMKKLISDMKSFIKTFNEFFFRENMVCGAECNQFKLGGQLVRYEYILNCLQNYVKNGTPIEELEDELLVPSWEPLPEYDSCVWATDKNIATYNYWAN